MRNLNCFAESAIILFKTMANCKENDERAHKTYCIGEKVEIKTILASSFLSDHSNMYKSVFVNDIHNQLMTSVNPEISCIRMGSGPALFGLARFYCNDNHDQLTKSCTKLTNHVLYMYICIVHACV